MASSTGRHALSLDGLAARKARDPAGARPAGVRDAARGGLRAGQAAGDGLRDDHRSRHDRRRAADRRPPRRVRLGGADRLVPRRAAGRARALLRDHAGRPRLAAGAQRRRRGVRRVPARARDRLRAGASLLRGRGAAHAAPPPPPGASCSRSGRRATARARRELNMPAAIYIETHGGTGIGGSDDHAGVDIGRTFTETPRAATPEEFLAHLREGQCRGPRRPGQRRQVGARGDGAGGASRSAAASGDPDPRPRACWPWPSGSSARATSAAARRAPASARQTPQPAARLARVGGPRTWRWTS